jgi:acetate kinase
VRTRSGDIDPAIIDFLTRRGYSPPEVNSLLNKKSGLLGLSGISNDLRDLEAAAAQGNQRAVEALDVYAYRVRKYVGAYVRTRKVDALVFAADRPARREDAQRICHHETLSIYMDYGLGSSQGSSEARFGPSPITILVVRQTRARSPSTLRLISAEAFRRSSVTL